MFLRIETDSRFPKTYQSLNQSSAFVLLQLPEVNAQRVDGTTVTNSYGLPGRVVIVGNEPLLEALRISTNQVLLLQYAIPNSTIRLERTTNFPPFGSWLPSGQTIQSNLVQEAGRFNPNAPLLFFRAVRN